MLGQHLKQLVESDLIEEVPVKKEVANKIGRRNVNGYLLKNTAFLDLFLEISFFSDEVLSFFDLHESNLNSGDDSQYSTVRIEVKHLRLPRVKQFLSGEKVTLLKMISILQQSFWIMNMKLSPMFQNLI